jgi:orotate phosphoribosyltransferase
VLNFRTISDLNLAITKKLHDIRQLDIDLVVGIPRSGMLPATLIATHLQLPFTDIDSYNSGRWYVRHKKLTVPQDRPQTSARVLLVDDSINTGHAMRSAVSTLEKNNDTVIRFAVYGSIKTASTDIDFVCESCALPRAFQWNIWKHQRAQHWATDMDGVLCRDPTKKENDRGARLEHFYHSVSAKYRFSKPIKYVITSRLDRYREITARWLDINGIKYDQLIMKPDHVARGNDHHATFKASVINELRDIELYIESDPAQARIISTLTGIPVWCTDNQTLYQA